ncbi:lipid IV(A) 3-deoxy-D-manno-octulosonic acid transferase [Campylobacter jejuni]|nr:3-deoxy-D-manno-octulosonic acid transferase [Campylobacter jejuni]EAJ8135935.1 3-deoxy-D-manno-octulosonic acid transferase [Campylobacter jejuni]EAL4401200.1 3-deoxy-D-manno-octulosonic acid transferase [Campylobacter jejuni]EAM0747747.1 3-deoxy-D-manno-octulosonic acid transferase [Campylobacter jejuni]ECR5789198.1 3-deoxy-D-manno-octulosonic acid transferase [Campylobacter jejuni]
MIFFYYFLTWTAFLFCAVFILLLSFLKSKYKISLKSRFFLYKNLHQEKADVHFHACSYGEVRSIKALVLKFDSRITTITQTGFECAKEFCKKVNYLAFENFLPFWFNPCKVLVIFEAEYWLMLVFMARIYKAKIILLNARISDKSYHSYQRFSFFYKKNFSYIDEVFAQSELDKVRLESLGAKNVKIFKNIKANLEIKNNKIYTKPKEKLIIFASTHKDEEELLLDHFKLEENEKLIIAPRHPERFKEVENLLLNKGLEFEKFSSLKDENKKFSKKILLLDALGELVNFYAISDVVVLGGSFIEGIGGHNPIEAAYFDNVLISGKFIHNQKALFEEVENVYFCENLKDLNDKIHYLNLKAKISKKGNLDLIIQTIQKGIDARKSL